MKGTANRYGFLWSDENILELYTGDDCRTLNTLKPLNCTRNRGECYSV